MGYAHAEIDPLWHCLDARRDLIQIKPQPVSCAYVRLTQGVERNMATLGKHEIDALRERAEHYRRLAGGPVPWSVVAQRLADECEREASAMTKTRWRAA
jgi:hypothetical protein